MNRMQRVRRKYAINRNKKKKGHVWGQAKQRQSRKRGFTHARGDQPRKEKRVAAAALFFIQRFLFSRPSSLSLQLKSQRIARRPLRFLCDVNSFFRVQILPVAAAPSVVKIAKVRKLTFAMDSFL
jgi:hypothetical protein